MLEHNGSFHQIHQCGIGWTNHLSIGTQQQQQHTSHSFQQPWRFLLDGQSTIANDMRYAARGQGLSLVSALDGQLVIFDSGSDKKWCDVFVQFADRRLCYCNSALRLAGISNQPLFRKQIIGHTECWFTKEQDLNT